MTGRFQGLWQVLNMSCRDQSRLMSRSLDGEVSRELRLALRVHTLTCWRCRALWNQLSFLQRICRLVALERYGDEAYSRMPGVVRERLNSRFGP
jgi:hypothetical protein